MRMKPFSACWYDAIIYDCVDLLLGSKTLGDEKLYQRYSKLYDYLVERKRR